ncbi:YdcF family protein [Streptomyces xanthophaeus]
MQPHPGESRTVRDPLERPTDVPRLDGAAGPGREHAAAHRERAIELGVPPAAVLVEPRATNTGENVHFTRTLLQEKGVKVDSVLLVCKPYEGRRTYATARKLWPGVEIVSASTSMTFH